MTTEQAKLLQIGDIVLFDNKVSYISYVDFDTQKDVLLMKFESAEVFSDEECEQIPLTQEILEKNGFVVHTLGGRIEYSFPKGIDTRPAPFASFLCVIQGGDTFFIEDHTLIKVKTVDEFQRLLRSMGFIDFANNFKV